MRLIRQYQFQSTLPQGERLLTTQEHFIEDVFQSTLPQGERHSKLIFSPCEFIFQSTLPQGERPCSALKCNLQHNFNPRSHKGSDGYGHKRIIRVEQFQSTLPQGERPYSNKNTTAFSVFQSTLPQGERHVWSVAFHFSVNISIHAPTRGATR